MPEVSDEELAWEIRHDYLVSEPLPLDPPLPFSEWDESYKAQYLIMARAAKRVLLGRKGK